MNQLLLKDAPAPGSTVTVTGARAEHIRNVLRSKPGDTLKAGVFNGLSGHGVIRSVEKVLFCWIPLFLICLRRLLCRLFWQWRCHARKV